MAICSEAQIETLAPIIENNRIKFQQLIVFDKNGEKPSRETLKQYDFIYSIENESYRLP